MLCEKCNKIYKERTGLWKHKKICFSNKIEDSNKKELNYDNNIQLLKNMFIDVIKEIQPTIHNSFNNNNNETFNLQFFVNEICKDAMS